MKTLLILAPLPDLADAVRAVVDPARHRVLHRASLAEAEPFLERGLADGCLLDLELTGVESAWTLETLRRRLPGVPLLVVSAIRSPEWEEQAYLQGATHVLAKPVRPRLLAALLERLEATPAPPAPDSPAPVTPPPPPPAGPRPASESLALLRQFSGVLRHSLDAPGLLREFLRQVRDVLGVNRAALFLRPPEDPAAAPDDPARSPGWKAAAAIGLPASLLEHLELPGRAGLAGHLQRHGRILRAGSPEALADAAVRQEFERLGAQIALPILDGASLVGLAVLDGRVTGEPLANAELELVFHLLEELGLAIGNLRVHGRLTRNHELLCDALRELGSACVVVGSNLAVLHANKAARQLLARARRTAGAELEFADLPPDLAAKVGQVLRTGAALAPFAHTPAHPAGASWSVAIVPLFRDTPAVPHAALLVVEDHTEAAQLRRLESEAAGLRLLRSMADRIAHEVGNAMVPISTHQQLLAERFRDAEFRASLDLALSEGVKRVNRLISQMRFLAREAVLSREPLPLGPLLEEAFKEAHRHQPVRAAKLLYEDAGQAVVLSGDRAALRHALAEVFLNALQANPGEPKVRVSSTLGTDAQGRPVAHIDVFDTGEGFTPDAAQKAPTPFFTTRTVGLGLGLCVVRKICETHEGRLVLPGPTQPGQPNRVRLTLPGAQ
ncbi:MAG: hypothetical protein RJA22_267 [Verrucomicrobiota bacterium]